MSSKRLACTVKWPPDSRPLIHRKTRAASSLDITRPSSSVLADARAPLAHTEGTCPARVARNRQTHLRPPPSAAGQIGLKPPSNPASRNAGSSAPIARRLSVRPVGAPPIYRAIPSAVSGETLRGQSGQAHESMGLASGRAAWSARWIWPCMFVGRAGCRQKGVPAAWFARKGERGLDWQCNPLRATAAEVDGTPAEPAKEERS
jgi:hypothetical protein